MSLNEIEPLHVTGENGEHIDLTHLLEMFRNVEQSAMQSREHSTGKGILGVSKDTVAGIKMGMQMAVRELYGKSVGNAFARRLNPDAPDWQYPTDV